MQVLIELDAETLRRLEAVAPGKSRKRSAFIRAAIQRSLWAIEEEKTRRAYLADPDVEPTPFDPSAWDGLAFGGFDDPRGETVDRPRRSPPPKRKKPARGRARAAIK